MLELLPARTCKACQLGNWSLKVSQSFEEARALLTRDFAIGQRE